MKSLKVVAAVAAVAGIGAPGYHWASTPETTNNNLEPAFPDISIR